MSYKFKVFLIAFFLSLPFWWGINVFGQNLNEIFFLREIARNPQILTAQILADQQFEKLQPVRNKSIENLEIGAKSAISVLVKENGSEKILFEKDIDQRLPIASLTKLITASVVLENYDLNKEIEISQGAVDQPEELGQLTVGMVLSVRELLYPLLIESSNDAAYALVYDYNEMTEKDFIGLMNLTAINLGLSNNNFTNPSGLDPKDPKALINYSTTKELSKLIKYLLRKPLIWEILSIQKHNFYGVELINTNELLGEISGIIGGKTGETPEAKDCFVLVLKAPNNNGHLINIILGSDDRFGEMRKLVTWARRAYQW